jgi:hypothetical protein
MAVVMVMRVAETVQHRRPQAQLETSSVADRPSRPQVAHSVRLARDHHLGRLDDGDGGMAAFQFEGLDAVARDDGGQLLVPDAEPHLRQEAVNANFVHDSTQLIAAA